MAVSAAQQSRTPAPAPTAYVEGKTADGKVPGTDFSPAEVTVGAAALSYVSPLVGLIAKPVAAAYVLGAFDSPAGASGISLGATIKAAIPKPKAVVVQTPAPLLLVPDPNNKDAVMSFQRTLCSLGFGDTLGKTGPNHDGVDGIMGPRTMAAYAQAKDAKKIS